MSALGNHLRYGLRAAFWGIPLFALPLSAIGCGSTSEQSKRQEKTRPLVVGRSPKPEDITAPGIEIPSGSFSVAEGAKVLTINANNWNTITGSSQVQRHVRVLLQPDYQRNPTSVARFQYLGDRIAALGPSRFDIDDIAGSPKVQRWIDLSAVVNTTDCALVLDRIDLTIVDRRQPRYVVAAGTFFTGAHSAKLLPPTSVSFITFNLVLRHSVTAREHVRQTHTMFHYIKAPEHKGCH